MESHHTPEEPPMTDARSAFEALDRLEDQARERARDTEGEPLTPEQRHEQWASTLAERLKSEQSRWVTFGGNR
jgi:hypothetical protein